MELAVAIKQVYGNETIYPANEAARLVAHIAGTRTLTRRALMMAEQLGHTITVIAPRLKLVAA